MPVFNDFSQDGKLLSSKDELLNSENLQRYLTEFGTDRTKGYRDAMHDLLKNLEQILFYHWQGRTTLNPTTRVRSRLEKHYNDRLDFLNTLNELFPQPNESFSDTKLDP